MLTFTDEALILTVDKFGDSDAIVALFTLNHGLVKGVVKRGLTSKNRADIQPATLAEATWKARLPEHMGTITLEARHSFAARVMRDPLKLSAVGSVMALIAASLAERDAHTQLYTQTLMFLQHVAVAEPTSPSRGEVDAKRRVGVACEISIEETPTRPAGDLPPRGGGSLPTSQLIWLAEYVRLELALLELAGFGLDLTSCAATGSDRDLVYVSPKSGRAVSRAAGAAYHDRMLALPEFVRETQSWPDTLGEILAGIALSGYFIHQRMLPALHRKPPHLRAHFAQLLDRMIESKAS
jgi:DNA repair protein RecO (recombination protein O)